MFALPKQECSTIDGDSLSQAETLLEAPEWHTFRYEHRRETHKELL